MTRTLVPQLPTDGELAAILMDNAMPADPWDDGSLPMILPPLTLEQMAEGDECEARR